MSLEALLARSVQIFVALLGAYLVVLWFVSIVWTYRDIEARSRNIVTQISATVLPILFPFLGIPLYLILRPKESLDAAFQKSLEEEYLLQDLEELPLCPTCQRFVADDFVLCPHCHTRLREACSSCGRLVDLRWTLCPYCGAEQDSRGGTIPVPATSRPSPGTPTEMPERISVPVPPARPEQQPVAASSADGLSRRAILSVVGRSESPGAHAPAVGEERTRPLDVPPRRRRFLRPGVDLPLDGAGSNGNGATIRQDVPDPTKMTKNGTQTSDREPQPVHAERE